MRCINNRQSAGLQLKEELRLHCQSELLSVNGIRKIIRRHGRLTPNENENNDDYHFFLDACDNERVTEGIIQCLLNYFPDAASATDRYGTVPLHYACDNPNVTKGIVQLLIEAYPNSVWCRRNYLGSMPLHILCGNRHSVDAAAMEILRLLIEKYPETIRHADREGNLPIHHASAMRSLDFCRVLIDVYPGSEEILGANGSLPLHWACAKGSLATVEYLHRLFPQAIDLATTNGFYPCHTAIHHIIERYHIDKGGPAKAAEIIQFLLNCNPNVKLQKYKGKSLLHCACEEKISVLFYACELESDYSNIEAGFQIIKAIYGARPEAIEDNIITSNIRRYDQRIQAFIKGELVYARQAKDSRTMMTPDDNGRLPLHRALQNNAALGSIKLLVQGNSHAVHSPDNSGALPLHSACQHHDSASVVQYLMELDTILGLDATSLGAVDQEGNTALHYACRGAKYDTIALLVEKFDAVSVSKRNGHGKLPIELLWESIAVEDRESVGYVESIFRLLKAYPETLRNVGKDLKSSVAACHSESGNGKKSCRNSLLVSFRKAMRSSRKRVQNRQKPVSASDGLP